MAEEAFSEAFGPLPEGSLLGHYRINGFTAASSAGEVYSATDTKNQKSCSLLVISSAVSGHSPDIAARLLKNAQKACFFRHKNFVSIIDSFQDSGCFCIVTESISGRTLRDLIESGSPLPVSAENIIFESSKLLASTEKFAALFLEFSPDDLLVTESGRVKFLYPGIGSLLPLLSAASLHQKPQLQRNAVFIAPELLLGNGKASFAASVYSLGAVFSFMVNDSSPFRNGDCAALAAVLHGTTDKIGRSRNAGVLRQLLAKDPDQRIRTSEELLRIMGEKKNVQKSLNWLAAGVLLCVAAVAALCYLKTAPAPSSPKIAKKIHKKINEHQLSKKILNAIPSPAPAKPATAESAPAAPPRSKQVPPAPAAPSVPAEKLAETAPAPEIPLYQAVRDLSVPSEFSLQQSLTEKLQYSRSRLEQLEDDIARKVVDPRLMKLHRERIEFRKKQILRLNTRRQKQLQKERVSEEIRNSAFNKELRQEVAGYFAPCKSQSDFMRYRHLVSTRKGQPFPVAELKKPGVDFNMVLEFPALPRSAALSSSLRERSPRKTTLALLMLNGFLMPVENALALLADSNQTLDHVSFLTLNNILWKKNIPEQHIRYLVNEINWKDSLNTAHNMLMYFSRFELADILLEELLLSGYTDPSRVLHFFTASGNTRRVSLLLRAEASLEHKDFRTQTALFAAYQSGYPACVKLLLEAGADPRHKDHFGKTAKDYESLGELAAAIREKNLFKAECAINQGADVNAFFFHGETPLIAACRSGHKNLVELLINRGADVNKSSRQGGLPLEEAFRSNSEAAAEIFEVLISKDAKPRFRGNSKMDLLDQLCLNPIQARRQNAPRLAEILLKTGKYRPTARHLFSLCNTGNAALFSTLIKHSPQLNGPEYNGLLIRALSRKMPAAVIKEMVDRGVPMPDKRSLQSFLEKTNDPQLAKIFSAAANGEAAPVQHPDPRQSSSPAVQQPDTFGVPINDWDLAEKASKAIKRQWRGELEKLLDKQISPDAVIQAKTLLQHAAEQNSFIIAKMLLDKKAGPYTITRNHRSYPATLAIRHNAPGVFRLIVKHKAPNNNVHLQIMHAILKKGNAAFYLKEYLKYHKDEVRDLPVCFLTYAMAENASNEVLVELINLYRKFTHKKHQAVLHQALWSRYRPALIKVLLDRGAPVTGRQLVRRKNMVSHETVLSAARKTQSSKLVLQFLRQKGVK